MSAVQKEVIKYISDDHDDDPQETIEWLEALSGVISYVGAKRAHFLIEKQIEFVRLRGEHLHFSLNTPYINTIPPEAQIQIPGDQDIERTIRSYTRWNALAMVLRAGKNTNVGGHIASFSSAATLYDIGFNHFWHAPSDTHGGDLIFIQGHSSPGAYSRAFLLGRLSEEQLDNFRQEINGNGISSYPHPWLMPDFWQFPTVSMGLGPIMAIYQARFMKYLELRGIVKTSGRKVWAFLGDGETDEPESIGSIGMASREKLDNLIFVINCNLQRLDGPVRGNGKIIQELESEFRGSGWNVIKVIWGSRWDELFARDKSGRLMHRMMEVVDGEYQTYRSESGAYIRKHFFNTPELKALVSDWSDDDIWNLNRGGHDPHKIYAAFHEACKKKDVPTLILAKTIKGYGMGESGQAMNITHQQKKLPVYQLKKFRDQFCLPISDDDIESIPYLKFDENSKELKYMRKRRMDLGGYLPQRRQKASESLLVPELSAFDTVLKGTGEGRKISTTMIFVRILNILLKDKVLGNRIVPIVPDESRTFGMESLFRQIGIWNQEGQKYLPEDSDQLMFYKELKTGQIIQEGINEAGGMCDWIAAATSYSTHGKIMVPFYIFYSMFGFQRVGDLAWAAGDMRSRGFLLGATAGRTTLNGEGLQHEDGHSLLWASSVPNCASYDPTFGYELAVIIQNGLIRMVQNQEDLYYYITVMNENYEHPVIPQDIHVVENIIKGMYAFQKTDNDQLPCVQLLGSGAIFNEVIAAAKLLKNDWGIVSNLWSVPSFTELAREGHEIERWNMLHPTDEQRLSHVQKCLKDTRGPVIASSDYVRALIDQIRGQIDRRFVVLGTDGYGRSDTRENLRNFFEVDRYWITVAAMKALADEGTINHNIVSSALVKYALESSKPNPMTI
ncbi:MAG: pyruvate dehydrogenase (acetyl-transferring), homodimeric type [Burkholderia sp.]|nr:pyruvate dehydrogenase (acetyl-transferring), homodimeric type [Burkholderia sp.]